MDFTRFKGDSICCIPQCIRRRYQLLGQRHRIELVSQDSRPARDLVERTALEGVRVGGEVAQCLVAPLREVQNDVIECLAHRIDGFSADNEPQKIAALSGTPSHNRAYDRSGEQQDAPRPYRDPTPYRHETPNLSRRVARPLGPSADALVEHSGALSRCPLQRPGLHECDLGAQSQDRL